MKIIEAKNISFGYGSETIFSDINFDIDSGDFAALIGANGAGKSTILKLLLGELPLKKGEIRLMGQDIHAKKNFEEIGYVPQNGLSSAAHFPATALEIVLLSLYKKIGLFRLPGKKHREMAMHALDQVGLEALHSRLIGSLSGGQLQRVMLAKVLVAEPQLMVLDEPTVGVDSETVDSLFELLVQLNQKEALTILLVTHEMNRVSQFASKIYCLEEGSLVKIEKEQLEHELKHRHVHPH